MCLLLLLKTVCLCTSCRHADDEQTVPSQIAMKSRASWVKISPSRRWRREWPGMIEAYASGSAAFRAAVLGQLAVGVELDPADRVYPERVRR